MHSSPSPPSNFPRVAYLTAGGAGMFCGSCMRDNALAAALIRQGVDIQLIPLYTPVRTDEELVTIDRVFFGGLNVYLQQNSWLFRALPGLFDWFLDQPWLISYLASGAVETDAAELGEMTVSMLRGENGYLGREVDKLCRHLVDEVRPNVVNLTNVLIAGCVPTLKRELDAPVFVTLQGDDIFLDGLIEPYRQQALDEIHRLVDQIDGFITFSRYYADFMAEMLQIDPAKIHLTPMGIDVRDFAERQAANRTPGSRPPRIGYLARLAPEKGLHLLCEAFRALRERPGLEDAELWVAGWLGEKNRRYADEHFGKLQEAGLDGAFRYLGEVDRKGKLEFLGEIDLLSVPTVYREPKGLFVLEALAAGVPVVQPAHGAFPELIEATGGGRTFPPGDSAALAEAIAELLADDAARADHAERGRAVVHERFSAEAMATATLALYQASRAGR